jgi:hypothetical protein
VDCFDRDEDGVVADRADQEECSPPVPVGHLVAATNHEPMVGGSAVAVEALPQVLLWPEAGLRPGALA